jgi:hypothetical protein
MTGLGMRGPRPWKKPLTLILSQWERKKEGTSRNQYDNALGISFAVFYPYWRLAHESATATSMPVR